ncbi:universal stress protein [Sulfitobacter sp. JBTF-M27]|uniref:Universal stress protein n=1 Tax=Sulfitobacter sediminilitoris TaxID=2698830 RepID=A0A6P0C6X8_9RHOB|nr:universal stress protein [Sulfitobacter sediminilitoris]NEK21919.1 universal stress protein [Sulfitobacter sediminilitoris]
MYRKILVPMALDHNVSPQTIEIAKALTGGDGEIIALHVYEAPQGSVTAYLDEDAVKEGFERARKTLTEKLDGIDGIKAELIKGHTYRTIIDYATANGIDCIVIGSHKPGLSDYLLGSTAARVVRHAPCAVHVHRSS